MADRAAALDLNHEFDHLYETCYEVAVRAALAELGNLADAEDAVQAAFVTIWGRLDRDLPIKEPAAYVNTYVRNQARNLRSHRARRSSEELSEQAAAAETGPDGGLRDAARFAWDCAQRLPDVQREVVVRRLYFDQALTDLAADLQLSADAVQKHLARGIDALGLLLAEASVARRAVPDECRQWTRALWRISHARPVEAGERQRALEHVAECAVCARSLEEFKVAFSPSALALLFPLDRVQHGRHRLRRELDIQLVASVRRRFWPGRRHINASLALLVFLIGLAVWILFHQVPAAGACTVARDHGTGYAYLSGGEVLYAAGSGSQPRRLTSTGGRVDAFWWSPDGRHLAYKVATAAPDIAGVIDVVDVTTGARTWTSVVGADAFAYSPDGCQFALASRVLAGGNWSREQIRWGSFAGAGAARQVDVGLGDLPYDPATLQDQPGLPRAALHPLQGLFWTPGGIYYNRPDWYSSIDPATGQPPLSGGGRGPDTAALENAWFGVPSSSPFHLQWATGLLTQTCSGSTSEVSWSAFGGSRPEWMSVSSDGKTALVSATSAGGVDLYRLTACEAVQRRTSDGLSSLPKWQP